MAAKAATLKPGAWVVYDLGAQSTPRYIHVQLVKALSPKRWALHSPEYGACSGWADSILLEKPEVVNA